MALLQTAEETDPFGDGGQPTLRREELLLDLPAELADDGTDGDVSLVERVDDARAEHGHSNARPGGADGPGSGWKGRAEGGGGEDGGEGRGRRVGGRGGS